LQRASGCVRTDTFPRRTGFERQGEKWPVG
jgi:hypothetical protein